MTKTTTSLSAAFALTLALGLGACSSDDEPATTPTQTEEASPEDGEGADDDASDDGTADDGTTEDSGDGSTGDGSGEDDSAGDDAGGDDDGTGAAALPPPGDDGDLTEQAFRAIDIAEQEAGGTAYEIDDQDRDGSWEVDVRVDDRSVEVTVGQDGTIVKTEEDSLDDEDRAALEATSITLQEAIQVAIDEVGGVLDDAGLEEDNGEYYWEVELDGTDQGDDIEVKVSVDGEVLQVG